MSESPPYIPVCALIYGGWGAGKTRLAAASPGPVLFLDAEDSAHHTGDVKEYRLVDRSDRDEAKGLKVIERLETLGADGVDINYIYAFEDELDVHIIQTLVERGKHSFRTIVLDSFTTWQEGQKMDIASDAKGRFDPDAAFTFDKWGSLYNRLLMLVTALRKIAKPNPTVGKPTNVIILCGADMEGTKPRPLLQGAMRKRIGGIPDIFACLKDEVKEGKAYQTLIFVNTPTIEGKCRLSKVFEKYPSGRIVRPTISALIDAAQPTTNNKEKENG